MLKIEKITILQKNLCEHFSIPFRLIDGVINAERKGLETILVNRWQIGSSDRYYMDIIRTTFHSGSIYTRKIRKNLHPEMSTDDWTALEKLCKELL